MNLIAAPLKERMDSLIHSQHADHGVLPVIALYGANASGKSNTLLALSFLRSVVLNSFAKDSDAQFRFKPFLLDEDSRHKPCKLVIDFVTDGVRYQFGTELSRERVVAEWLYQYPKRSRQILYERNLDVFRFGRSLMGSNRQIQSITRPNALFLSTAATSAHPALTPISDFFRNKLVLQLSSATGPMEMIAMELEGDGELTTEVVKYLALADTGISELRIERTPMPESTRGQLVEFMTTIKKMVGDIPPNTRLPSTEDDVVLQLGHTSGDDRVRFLDYSDESLGTKYLLKLLPPMLRALKTGSTLVLDEITTSLHTLLARQLVSLFHDKKLNRNGAQLIFSTHDTNLLTPGLLRRDEIWFAEKGRDGATVVFPLTDIKTKNTDNIERGYIQGRFGAIPFVREPDPELHG